MPQKSWARTIEQYEAMSKDELISALECAERRIDNLENYHPYTYAQRILNVARERGQKLHKINAILEDKKLYSEG